MPQEVARCVVLACIGPADEEVTAIVDSLLVESQALQFEKPVPGTWLSVAPNTDERALALLCARTDVCAIVFVSTAEVTLPWAQDLCKAVGATRADLFRVIFSAFASVTSLVQRHACCSQFDAHMVSHVPRHVVSSCWPLLRECGTGPYTCPMCKKSGLTGDELWVHVPQYHVGSKKHQFVCPICGVSGSRDDPLVPHIFEKHPPASQRHAASRQVVPMVAFGLCVIQRKSDGKFLVVQEYNHQGFWLPGGGIDPGEFPVGAAKREALEEAGLAVDLTGILRVEYNCRSGSHVRLRFIFYGHPVDEADPIKTSPDFESVGAAWVSIDDVLNNTDITWRGEEPLQWFSYVANGGQVHPISVIRTEGAPAPVVDGPHKAKPM